MLIFQCGRYKPANYLIWCSIVITVILPKTGARGWMLASKRTVKATYNHRDFHRVYSSTEKRKRPVRKKTSS